MLDTMTMTKTVGAACGALLVFLLIGFAGEKIYGGAEGHGEEEQAYVIATEGGESSGEAEAGPAVPADLDALIAAADPAAGEKVFSKCKACHKIDGGDGTGPHLNGVVNRAKASVPGFAYSAALTGMSADSWTPANLFLFLESPKAYAPGTKMTFAGLPKQDDRVNIIAYLASKN